MSSFEEAKIEESKPPPAVIEKPEHQPHDPFINFAAIPEKKSSGLRVGVKQPPPPPSQAQVAA